MKRMLLGILPALALGGAAHGATVFVEAEAFAERGGWVVDTLSMDSPMGSPYLLAHGLGTPVADAVTTVAFPEAGTYRVFVRTKDWVARWKAPGAPGKFQVLIDGKPLAETFGTRGADWFWHDGGRVEIAGRQATVALHDLTGFDGRCDAIVFTSDAAFQPPNDPKALAAFRRQALGLPEKPDEAGEFDVVVTGGGVAGCCAAVSAARLGLKVALLQDRPALGGNSSSEVRVWIQGRIHQQPYPVLGEIVEEMLTRPKEAPDVAEAFGDDLKYKVVSGEPNVTLRLWEHVNGVETDGGRIRAVVSQNVLTGRRSRYAARWFVDATGDATVGALAGADFEVTPRGHMGSSNLWMVSDTGKPVSFPRCPWALDLTNKPFPTALKDLGRWFWESGFDADTIQEAEAIRDHNLRAMFGAWDCLKNVKNLYPNHALVWAAYISGKRESRRLLGDIILTQDDVLQDKRYPDGCVPTTWTIDLHYPDPKYVAASPDNPFISYAKFTKFNAPYPVPYRCLYSRNVPNLMMAGRNISVTHEALGTVRVMATGGMMGEVVGRALALCKKHDALPRDIYEKYLDELKELLQKPTRPGPARQYGPVPEPASNPLEGQVGENVARSAKLTTSGDRDAAQYPPSNLTDGQVRYDNARRWLSKAEMPAWVELAWDQPQTIVAARILSGYVADGRPGEPIENFVLQVHDGAGWKDIPGTRVTGNAMTDWHARFEPVTARRVRLLVEKARLDIARLWEIELYAPAARKP